MPCSFVPDPYHINTLTVCHYLENADTVFVFAYVRGEPVHQRIIVRIRFGFQVYAV